MNIQKMFETQAKLDDRIVKEKGLQGQDLLDKKILALQVELGELANELPDIFKFWSNKKNDYDKALTELVDCLHFMLSVGLEVGYIGADIQIFEGVAKEESIVHSFQSVFECVSEISFPADGYSLAFSRFIELSEMLGFTWEQIEDAYYEKNAINHERQDNGY